MISIEGFDQTRTISNNSQAAHDLLSLHATPRGRKHAEFESFARAGISASIAFELADAITNPSFQKLVQRLMGGRESSDETRGPQRGAKAPGVIIPLRLRSVRTYLLPRKLQAKIVAAYAFAAQLSQLISVVVP